MDHTVKNKHFPGVFEATPLRAPVRPWGHAPRQANPVLTQGRRGAQGRDTPPFDKYTILRKVINHILNCLMFPELFDNPMISVTTQCVSPLSVLNVFLMLLFLLRYYIETF